ncbi:trypsin-like serine peptidase [Streptomyces roseoverticillatus]|uniref:trypsin-like serine peptidase n=1 Tax=Streptomyces roseoverticillatus TaxID=66429 RepID=UPI003F53FA7D
MPGLRLTVAVFISGLLAVTTIACGASSGTGASVPGRLAGNSPQGLKEWIEGGWKNWDKNQWQREAKDFFNPVIPGRWKTDTMKGARPNDKTLSQSAQDDLGKSDPEPLPVEAKPVTVPYHQFAAPVGKVFFDGPDGSMVCSGTVVTDPVHPGQSNMVWTAGHCVHAGKDGGWFRNIVFVPSYNDNGLPAAQVNSSRQDVLPFGVWWADWAQTSPQWIAQGSETGGAGAPFDFAVLHVKRPAGGGKSLEETVGSAVPVNFDAPAVRDVSAMSAKGYPAGPPFDGQLMFACDDTPGRLSVLRDQPTMYRIGCTMTGGSSGGGWFTAGADGRLLLTSNTSIGPADNTWLAGPRLGPEAKDAYTTVSMKFSIP